MNALSLILTLSGLLQVSGQADPSFHSQTQPDTLAAQLAETDSRKVAYVEHSGPYWSLGPVIDKVARDARLMGVQDKLVIRYLDDPVAASPRTLRAEVGFELAGTDLPKSPYKVAQWPIALVARKTVSGPDGLSTRHFTSLKAWAQTQGLAPAGDLIAIVELAEDGESTAIESTEIQLPVCVPDPPAVKAPPALVKSPEAQPGMSDAASAGRVPRNVTKVIQLPVPGASDEEHDANDGKSVRIALGTPVEQAPDRPFDSPIAKPVTVAPVPAPILPIRQWVEDGKLLDVARAVFPENLDPSSRQWADQIAARIIALSNGVQKLTPGEEGWLGDLATHLADRRAENRADSQKGTPRVIGPSSATGTKEAQRKAITQELDRLMANVSHRALNPDQIRENLIQLLERVHPLVLP